MNARPARNSVERPLIVRGERLCEKEKVRVLHATENRNSYPSWNINFDILRNNLSANAALVNQVVTVIEISIVYEPNRILMMLQERMNELGLSQTQLGQLAFGKANNSAIQALKAGSSPAVDRLEAIANAIEWEVYFGPPRAMALAEDTPHHDLGKPEGLRAGYVPIPWHELARQKQRPPICIDQAWLDRLSIDASALAMVQPSRVQARTATAETLAMIDRSARPSPEAQTWAYIERGTVTVGIIQNDRHALVLHGAEHGATIRLVTDKEREAIPLLGRVIWTGQMTSPPPK